MSFKALHDKQLHGSEMIVPSAEYYIAPDIDTAFRHATPSTSFAVFQTRDPHPYHLKWSIARRGMSDWEEIASGIDTYARARQMVLLFREPA